MTRLRTLLRSIRSSASDLIVLAGLALIALGLGLYSAPLAPIVLGIALIAAVRFGSR